MEKLKLVMRFYANCFARANGFARVLRTRVFDEGLTTKFQLRSRNYEIGINAKDFPLRSSFIKPLRLRNNVSIQSFS